MKPQLVNNDEFCEDLTDQNLNDDEVDFADSYCNEFKNVDNGDLCNEQYASKSSLTL